MKFLLCFIAIIMLSGCTHVELTGFDKEANIVTFQGYGFASQDDIQKEADNYCGKKATLIKINEVREGTNTSINKTTENETNVRTAPIKNRQYTFKCN